MNNNKRTVRITVYKFDGLTDKAKEHAFTNYSYYDVANEWWTGIYEDAINIGLEITASDYERYCRGQFIASAEETAHKIEADHGEQCETYKTAKAYLSERDGLINTWPKDEDNNFENEGDLDDKLDEIDENFRLSLLEDYRILLGKEYEYLTGRPHLLEIFEDWEFTKDGERF